MLTGDLGRAVDKAQGVSAWLPALLRLCVQAKPKTNVESSCKESEKALCAILWAHWRASLGFQTHLQTFPGCQLFCVIYIFFCCFALLINNIIFICLFWAFILFVIMKRNGAVKAPWPLQSCFPVQGELSLSGALHCGDTMLGRVHVQ